MPAKDNYARNNLLNHGVKVEYEKEDLSQVNHQLHEWLAIVNERSSKYSIHPNEPIVNSSAKKDAENLSEVENPDIRYNLDTTNTTKPKAKTKTEVVAENKELRAENRELKESKNQMRGMLEKLNREIAEYCHTKTKNPSH